MHSVVLINSKDSPVRLELSTFIELLSVILMSAGIFFPNSIITMSPGNKSIAGSFYCFPFLITNVSGGMKFVKPAIIASDFLF